MIQVQKDALDFLVDNESDLFLMQPPLDSNDIDSSGIFDYSHSHQTE